MRSLGRALESKVGLVKGYEGCVPLQTCGLIYKYALIFILELRMEIYLLFNHKLDGITGCILNVIVHLPVYYVCYWRTPQISDNMR